MLPTPIHLIPGGIEAEEEAQLPSLASRLAPWAVGLQVLALILGIYLAFRRPEEGLDTEDRSGNRVS